MKEHIKSAYIPCGNKPMRNLRQLVKQAGMLLPMGPARIKHTPRKAWHERP